MTEAYDRYVEDDARELAAVALDNVLTARLQKFVDTRDAKVLVGMSREMAGVAIDTYLQAKKGPPLGDPSCETCG
tara:strand:- start:160 stop:384 length:225 start_codon:yes stop_codon:yes gene_type:complete